MCYACSMCNKCGRYDQMKANIGKRICPACKKESFGDEQECLECGALLPPPFPKFEE